MRPWISSLAKASWSRRETSTALPRAGTYASLLTATDERGSSRRSPLTPCPRQLASQRTVISHALDSSALESLSCQSGRLKS